MSLVLGMAVTAHAAGDPITVVNNLSDFIFGLIRAVGLILLGWGIVQVGLSLQSHETRFCHSLAALVVDDCHTGRCALHVQTMFNLFNMANGIFDFLVGDAKSHCHNDGCHKVGDVALTHETSAKLYTPAFAHYCELSAGCTVCDVFNVIVACAFGGYGPSRTD